MSMTCRSKFDGCTAFEWKRIVREPHGEPHCFRLKQFSSRYAFRYLWCKFPKDFTGVLSFYQPCSQSWRWLQDYGRFAQKLCALVVSQTEKSIELAREKAVSYFSSQRQKERSGLCSSLFCFRRYN